MVQSTPQAQDVLAQMTQLAATTKHQGEQGFQAMLETAMTKEAAELAPGAPAENRQTEGGHTQGSHGKEKNVDTEKPKETDKASEENVQAAAVAAIAEPQQTPEAVPGDQATEEQMNPAVAMQTEQQPQQEIQTPTAPIPEQQVEQPQAVPDTSELLAQFEAVVEPQQPVPTETIQEPVTLPVQVIAQQAPPEELVQEKFDQMVNQAAEELTGMAAYQPETAEASRQGEAPGEQLADEQPEPKTFDVPRELRAELPEEHKEKLEQPAVVRALEKNVKSSAEKEAPEEPLLAVIDTAAASTPKAVEMKPLEGGAAEGPSPTEQIEAQVVEHLEQQKMEFRMQLHPQELGRVDVKMVLESGRLTVQIMAATAKTAELLTRQAEGLAASLRISGVDLQTVQVVTASQGEDGHMEQQLSMMMDGSDQSGDEQRQSGGPGTTGTQASAVPEQAAQQQEELPGHLLDRAI